MTLFSENSQSVPPSSISIHHGQASEKFQLVDAYNSPTSPRRDSLDSTPVSPRPTNGVPAYPGGPVYPFNSPRGTPQQVAQPNRSAYQQQMGQQPTLASYPQQVQAQPTRPPAAYPGGPAQQPAGAPRYPQQGVPPQRPLPAPIESTPIRAGVPLNAGSRPATGGFVDFSPVHVGNVTRMMDRSQITSQARPSSSGAQMAKDRKIASMSHQSWY